MQYPSRFKKPPWMHIGAFLFVVLLMLVDFKVAFHRAGQSPGSFGLSVAPSEARAANMYTALNGTRFVAVRSDIWTCFRMRENIRFSFGGIVTIPDRCQESHMVIVQTEACQKARSEGIECLLGTWRWVPNPPCGSDNPNGWWLPPC